MTRDRKELTRRQALKALAAAAGGLALNFVPKAWKTPVVSVGTLPAHAQISEELEFMDAIATTTTIVSDNEDYADFDFMMCTPNGYWIWNENNDGSDGATSSRDNIYYDPNIDNEWLAVENPVPGTYSIYIINVSAQFRVEIAVQITTNAGVFSTSFTLGGGQERAVADVTFPGGTVTWRSDDGFPPCLGDRSAYGK